MKTINYTSMKQKLLLLFLFFVLGASSMAQTSDTSKTKPFTADLLMGPYLFVDHTLYKSVFMKGARIQYKPGQLSLGIEYLTGQQHDTNNELGTTHSAAGIICYSLLKGTKRFNPYLYTGGGFFEFKDFSKDVLGVAFYAGAGTELNISSTIKGLIESRYVNLGPLQLEGKNELGVLWGVRAYF